MAATENTIGRCTCPVCKSGRASLRVSAKQLAYITCNTCNFQGFARSDRSDELLRALHIKDDAQPAPEAKPTPAPTPEHKPAQPQATPAQSAAPVIKQTGSSWGIFGGV